MVFVVNGIFDIDVRGVLIGVLMFNIIGVNIIIDLLIEIGVILCEVVLNYCVVVVGMIVVDGIFVLLIMLCGGWMLVGFILLGFVLIFW